MRRMRTLDNIRFSVILMIFNIYFLFFLHVTILFNLVCDLNVCIFLTQIIFGE